MQIAWSNFCCCCCAQSDETTPLNSSSQTVPKRDYQKLDEKQDETEDEMNKGKKLFNNKPKDGIKYLQNNHLLGEDPESVATFLKDETFLDKTMIGDYLGQHHEFNLQVLSCYVKKFDFKGLTFDEALRKFMGEGFRLPGEAQKIDRIMHAFALHYTESVDNKVFASSDVAYVLAFSVIMLNTDLHNPNVKQKITKEGFIRNNRGINNGQNLPDELLSKLYDSFKENELQLVEGLRFDDESYTFYHPEKRGKLLKLNSNMTIWNTRYFILTNNCLYYFLKENEKDPRGIIPLEGLEVRALEAQVDLPGKFCFELYDPTINRDSKRTIKSVKFREGKPKQGKRISYTLACDTEDERDEWMGMIITNTTPSLIQSLRTQRMAQIPGALENNALTELNLSLQSETENEVESPEFDEGLQKGNSIQFPIRRDDFSHSDHVSRSLSADDARRLSQTRESEDGYIDEREDQPIIGKK